MSLRNKIIGGLAALVAPILINGCVGNYQSSTISRICDNPTLISRDNDFEIRKAYISLKDEKIYRRGLENYERARINSEIPIVEEIMKECPWMKSETGKLDDIHKAVIGYFEEKKREK